tara:strand:- start:975 stop:1505 length:531 start_codon:yes stop_codon:yes gene_type:complete
MNATIINDEVLYAADLVIEIDALDIEELKLKAKKNIRKRIRVCTHKDIEENVHEMLIIHEQSCYVRPHKHTNKIESFHIIEGEADVVLFHDDGSIDKVIKMGELRTGLKFYYRLPPSCFHTILIRSDVLVFHEVTNGPFKLEDTVLADWAPKETDVADVSLYLSEISNLIEKSTTK